MIYAHGGLNLKSDEVPIIAQTGERVLSRQQNRDYEAGMLSGGAGGGTTNHITYSPVVNAIDARGVENILKKHSSAMVKIINQKIGTRGQKLGSGRY
jgi:hypothetical protein